VDGITRRLAALPHEGKELRRIEVTTATLGLLAEHRTSPNVPPDDAPSPDMAARVDHPLRASSVVVLPPDSASPATVLDAYLTALTGNDCQTARALGTSSFGNGELCGAVHVSTYSVDPTPAMPTDGEVIFATTLTTSGDGASIAAGDVTWFYDLVRQSNGAWRIIGGGSGP
jgi:hypothetical protein